MSTIPPQRIRLSPSSVAAAAASSKPVRPTLPLALMRQGSPTQRNVARRASPSPPVCWAHDSVRMKSRQSPDQRISPETKASLAAQGPKGATCLSSAAAECKGKPLSLLGGLMRRTASLDAICLTAQWPRDLHSYCGRPMVDRATQTPDDWKEVERIKFVQKKATLPPGDSLEMKYIRQRLQRTAQQQGGRTSPRWSPVQGDHQLGGLAAAPLSPPPSPSVAIPIQQPRRTTPPGGGAPRMRNSVEGLNQEIERLVLKGISGAGTENEAELERVMGPTPEGHRAPIAELFHSTCCSVDTQTPSGSDGSNGFLDSSSRHGSSRPDSLECDKSASPDLEVSGHTSKLGTSPQINKFLTREPPDGCEKVKIIDEGRGALRSVKPPSSLMAGGDGPGGEVLKPSSQFVLRPSQSSAFCPLVRNPFQGVHRDRIVDPFLLNERLQ